MSWLSPGWLPCRLFEATDTTMLCYISNHIIVRRSFQPRNMSNEMPSKDICSLAHFCSLRQELLSYRRTIKDVANTFAFSFSPVILVTHSGSPQNSLKMCANVPDSDFLNQNQFFSILFFPWTTATTNYLWSSTSSSSPRTTTAQECCPIGNFTISLGQFIEIHRQSTYLSV